MSTKTVTKYVLELPQGITYVRPMTWQSVAEDGSVSAIPLTGKILNFQLEKAKLNGTDFVMRSDQLPTAGGSSIPIINGPAAQFVLTIGAADLNSFQLIKTRYCIFYVNEDGSVTKIHNDFAEIKTIYG